MKWIFVTLLSTFWLIPVSVLAEDEGSYKRLKLIHPSGHHHVSSEELTKTIEREVQADEQNVDRLAEQLVDDIHEVSHNHAAQKSVRTFVRDWLHNLNLVNSTFDLMRWTDYRIHSTPMVKEHVHNLALLFGVSHVLETLSGPLGAWTGSVMGLPTEVNLAVLAVGGIISIPGLDPICIALAAGYKISKNFRVHTTKFRLRLSRVAKAAASGLYLPQLMASMGTWQKGSERILAVTQTDGQMLKFTISGGFLLFKENESALWLEQVGIEVPEKFWPAWDELKFKLDLNTRRAVDQLRTPHAPLPFYVRAKVDMRQFFILPGAIQPLGRWKKCDSWLDNKTD